MAPALAPQRVEVGRAIVAGDHCFAVYQERRCQDAGSALDDGRETACPVVAAQREAATRSPSLRTISR